MPGWEATRHKRHRPASPSPQQPQQQQASSWGGDDTSSYYSEDEECARGQFNGAPHTLLHHGRYELLPRGVLGKGTFGKVLACYDRVAHSPVAVKIIRSVKRYADAAREEADILAHVNASSSGGKEGVVRFFARFTHQAHECLVFEMLGCSLLEAQEQCGFRPFALCVIRSIARDLLHALAFLHDELNLVHTDLKMENVMFVREQVLGMDLSSHAQAGAAPPPRGMLRVKLIDFGNATFGGGKHTINTRQYRAPEVILGLDWDTKSDMFGFGCILMELFLGHVLFASNSIPQHLAMMERVGGNHRFPEWMIRASAMDCFHHKNQHVLLTNAQEWNELNQVQTLHSLVLFAPPPRWRGNEEELEEFYFLVRDLLCLDPRRRLRASDALNVFYL